MKHSLRIPLLLLAAMIAVATTWFFSHRNPPQDAVRERVANEKRSQIRKQEPTNLNQSQPQSSNASSSQIVNAMVKSLLEEMKSWGEHSDLWSSSVWIAQRDPIYHRLVDGKRDKLREIAERLEANQPDMDQLHEAFSALLFWGALQTVIAGQDRYNEMKVVSPQLYGGSAAKVYSRRELFNKLAEEGVAGLGVEKLAIPNSAKRRMSITAKKIENGVDDDTGPILVDLILNLTN